MDHFLFFLLMFRLFLLTRNILCHHGRNILKWIWTATISLIMILLLSFLKVLKSLSSLLKEVQDAIRQMSSDKAAGKESITPEVSKYDSNTKLIEKLLELLKSRASFLGHVSIRHLWKNGNKAVCNKLRGISLLCINGKILAIVILNRIKYCHWWFLPKVAMLFLIRLCYHRHDLSSTGCSKRPGKNQEPYMDFVDLAKVFFNRNLL